MSCRFAARQQCDHHAWKKATVPGAPDKMEDDSFSIAGSSTTSVSLNATYSEEDREGIALLRQIFADEPIEELRRIHHERLKRVHRQGGGQNDVEQKEGFKGKRAISFPKYNLPNDFLRLPTSVAVLRRVDNARKHEENLNEPVFLYESLHLLEGKVIEQIKARNDLKEKLLPTPSGAVVLTRAISRDPQIGLGMTLSYDDEVVKVYSVAASGDKRNDQKPSPSCGPSMEAGIQAGDIILGFNGELLSGYRRRDRNNGEDMLSDVVGMIRKSPEPVVVHIKRVSDGKEQNSISPFASLLDETLLDSSTDEHDNSLDNSLENGIPRQHCASIWSTPSFGQNGEPRIHTLVQLLSSRGLVPSKDEEMELSAEIAQFNERAWEMESFASLRLNQRRGAGNLNDTLIPLVGVRKALSVRIVNYFSEGSRTAYTIWVYDVESGQEWYAPLRYFEDFADLRHAAVNLIPRLGKLPFPRQPTSIFGSPRSNSPTSLETRCWQLEKFLRSLCGLLYESPLDDSIGEVAVHVQSFLGCESMEFDPVVGVQSQDEKTVTVLRSKNILKRSLQFYTYRAFLLKPLAFVGDDFVENMRQKCPSLQDLESIESQGVPTLQQIAMKDLATLEKFLNFLQSIILEGCMDDFRSITMHETFSSLRQSGVFDGKKGEIAWNALVRDAIREQVEVEAYVPLRSVVSRWLVNGWRHEDMEVHFKINELRKRPVVYFSHVPMVQSGPALWLSVSAILKENVERSTLPCAKLRAIVEAAREIARICANENESRRSQTASQVQDHREVHHPSEKKEEATLGQLGADQFLPILIYCVVMAAIERPCALCVLLRSLCDKVTRIGEGGYYLASFEASVVHIRDFDLSEQTDQMRSFVSVNLDAD